jgi:hypothetical protein
MVQSGLASARRQVPAQIRILGQELPEMECQLAFVADDCTFTGIKRLHCLVKMQYFSENSSAFSL